MAVERTSSPDDLYEAIVTMHEGLSAEESERANAKLILIMANHIGDADFLRDAAKLARENTLSVRENDIVGKDTGQ